MTISDQISTTYHDIIDLAVKFFEREEFNFQHTNAHFVDNTKALSINIDIANNLNMVIKVSLKTLEPKVKFKSHSNSLISLEDLNGVSQDLTNMSGIIIPNYIEYLRKNINELKEMIEEREHVFRRRDELHQERSNALDAGNEERANEIFVLLWGERNR